MSDSEWAFYLQIPNRCGQLGGDGVGQGQRNVLWVANLGNKWSISEYRLIAFAFAVLLKIQPPSSNIPQQPRISRPPIFGKQLIIRGNKNTAHFLSRLARCLGPDVRSYKCLTARTAARVPGSWPTEFSSRAERGADTLLLAATTKPSIAAINLPRDKKYATQGPGVSWEGVKKPLIRYFSRFSMGWVHISIG